jgi:hypothetical protein
MKENIIFKFLFTFNTFLVNNYEAYKYDTSILYSSGVHLKINKIPYMNIRGCIQKFPDQPAGARTANGTALCH